VSRRGNLKVAVSLFVMTVVVSAGYALSTESLPTYHWAYSVIEELQLGGILRDINLSERPVTRGQVAYEVFSAKGVEGKRNEWLLELLRQEFSVEVAELQPLPLMFHGIEQALSSVSREESPFKYDAGIRLEGDWSLRQRVAPQTDGIGVLQAGVQFRSNVAAHVGLRLDSHLPDDSTYKGKVWRGLAGYAESGYVRYEGSIFDAMFGRDRLTIGSGKSTHLLLSDYSMPMDVLWLSASSRHVRYSFVTAQLDTMLDNQYPDQVIRRFLALHRIWVRLHDRLSIGLSEAVLYGGPSRTFELQFLNPFLYWHGEVLNHAGAGNIFVMLDLDWYPWDGAELYGEFLIDDLQIERRVPKDLEPSEVGWIAGLRFTNLPLDPDLVLGLEYQGVTNRTYNSMTPYERYLHLGRPLGDEFGNDFDRWQISASRWIRRDVQCRFSASHIRKGEGSIPAPFDTTYLQYTVEQGYDEPFPTGIIEKETTISLGAFVIPTYAMWLTFEVGETWIANEAHVVGADVHQAWAALNVVLELDDLIQGVR